jgi:hypothetical protein
VPTKPKPATPDEPNSRAPTEARPAAPTEARPAAPTEARFGAVALTSLKHRKSRSKFARMIAGTVVSL